MKKFIQYVGGIVLAFLICMPNRSLAETKESNLITTEEAFVEALHNVEDGGELLVGDIEFAYTSPMGMTLSKSVTIKSGTGSKAVFSGAAFAVMGSVAEQDTLQIHFEDIWFQGINDVENIDFSEAPNIMAVTKIRPAMFFSRCVNATFVNCDFTGYSMANGGAIYGIYSSEDSKTFRLSLDFDNCTLNANVGGYGGAIYLSGAGNIFLNMKNCELSKNVAGYGGAIFADQATVSLQNCILSENRFVDFFSTTNTKGGALYVGQGTLTMKNCQIIQNQAKNGGGIGLAYTESVIDGCIISENHALEQGGAIWNENTGNNLVTIINSTIGNNTAKESGSIFISETEEVLGGGGLGKITFLLCTLTGNQPAMPMYENKCLSLFGCALYGEEVRASNENQDCYYAQQPHEGNVQTHLHSEKEIDIIALTAVANGKFANYHGVFYAGDNANESIPVTITLWNGKSETKILTYGEVLSLPNVEREGYTFDGWCYADGTPFIPEKLYLGANVEQIEIVAKWVPIKSSTEPPLEQPVDKIYFVVVLILIVIVVIFFVKRKNTEVSLQEEQGIGEVKEEAKDEMIEKTLELKEDKQWEEIKLLTEREKEVFELLLAGKKRKEIAEELFITEHTVKDHVHNVYVKLGVKNKNELFAKAMTFKN